MGARGSSGRALVAAVRVDTTADELAQAVTAADDARLVELAVHHRVPGRVHARLESAELLAPSALAELAAHRRRAAAHHLLALRLIERLHEVIPGDWVLFKGPTLARLYGAPDHRTYTDLDILVRRRDFRRSLEALTGACLVPVNRNWQGFLDRGVAELPLDSTHMTVDVHWHPLALRAHRQSLFFDADAMIDRRARIRIAAGEVDTFEPVDTLLYLCAHSGLGGGARLLWLLDIDVVVRSAPIDWDCFVAAAKAAGMSTMAAMLLERASRLLHTPVPREVENALQPSKLMLTTHRAMRRVPRSDIRTAAGLEYGLLQIIARDHVSDTAVALGAAIRERIRARMRVDSTPHPDLDWRRESGGPKAKTAWLDYIDSGRL